MDLTRELIIVMGDFNRHVGRNIDGFQGVHVGFCIGKRNQEGRMLLEYCDAKFLCLANTWFRKADKKNITYGSGCSESQIESCMMGKVDRKFFRNVKVISGELQHNLGVVGVDRKQGKKTEWWPGSKKEIVAKLIDEPYRQLF